MADEQIQALNQILAVIDEKATKFKTERYGMHAARKGPEKDLILKLIADALSIAEQIQPKPVDVINDLRVLDKDLRTIPA